MGGSEVASVQVNSTDTLLHLTTALERDLGESIMLMLSCGRVLCLADDLQSIHTISDVTPNVDAPTETVVRESENFH